MVRHYSAVGCGRVIIVNEMIPRVSSPCDVPSARSRWLDFDEMAWPEAAPQPPVHGVWTGHIPGDSQVDLGARFRRPDLDTGNVNQADRDAGTPENVSRIITDEEHRADKRQNGEDEQRYLKSVHGLTSTVV